MIADPRILVLDEATSNVDLQTEARIEHGPAAPARGADRDRDRAPALDDPRREPDRRARGRAHRRAGHPRGAARRRRRLREASTATGRRCSPRPERRLRALIALPIVSGSMPPRSRSATCASVRRRSTRSPASASRSQPARSSACWGPTVPARRRPPRSSRATARATAAACRVLGADPAASDRASCASASASCSSPAGCRTTSRWAS